MKNPSSAVVSFENRSCRGNFRGVEYHSAFAEGAVSHYIESLDIDRQALHKFVCNALYGELKDRERPLCKVRAFVTVPVPSPVGLGGASKAQWNKPCSGHSYAPGA